MARTTTHVVHVSIFEKKSFQMTNTMCSETISISAGLAEIFEMYREINFWIGGTFSRGFHI